MAIERPSEGWAAHCIGAALGVHVDRHEDDSASSMHDYWIRYSDRPPGAVEVTADADARMIQTWKAAEVHGGMR
jgi:hypothetical protein